VTSFKLQQLDSGHLAATHYLRFIIHHSDTLCMGFSGVCVCVCVSHLNTLQMCILKGSKWLFTKLVLRSSFSGWPI
jgi:hypothetical protein